MNVSIILGHPNPNSFNHAIARTVAEELERLGYTISFHDLYSENFDPLLCGPELAAGAPEDELTVRHCREIAGADGIVIIHPNWWGQPPAILKGWVDRVLHHGLAFRFAEGDEGGGLPIGLLRARQALVLNTSNTAPQREHEAFGDPLERLWKDCILGFCGVTNVRRKTYSIVCDSTAEQRQAWLDDVREIVRQMFKRNNRAALQQD